jgi:DNA-binding beta-propeller fold protein YncE
VVILEFMNDERAGRAALLAVLLAASGAALAGPVHNHPMTELPDAAQAAPVVATFDVEIGRGRDGVTFQGPFGLHVDAGRRLIVTDDLAHVAFVFGEDERLLSRHGGRGAEPGQLLYPDGVTTDARGHVYVADAGANRVQILDAAWTPLAEIRSWRLLDGRLANPRDVAVGRDGRIYVADFGNHCVRVFLPDRRHLLTMGQRGAEPGRFVNPVSVALDASDRLYVADQGNHRVQLFDRDGHVQRVIGSHGSDAGRFRSPMGLAVDASGRLYVADSGNARVQVLNTAGESLAVIDGRPEARLEQPVDVAVTSGRLYVSDAGRHAVQRYTIRP